MFEALLVAGIMAAPKNPTIELLEPKPTQETVEVKPEPKLYTIKQGDNLTKIAEATGSSVSRLWSANTTLTHPDKIEPEMVLKVPESDEVLPERALPVTVGVSAQSPTSGVSRSIQSAPSGRSSVSHKTGKQTPGWYYAGQCTAWVANKRYVPDGWGNATDWKWHAQAEGWTVSSVPVAGAIGWTYGHVVFVESVNGDTVVISEQNYDWNGSIRTITVPVGKYTYLY